MSAIHALASATANPLIILTRLLLGLFFIWLGLTKVIPGWSIYESDSTLLIATFAEGKIDGLVGLYVLGGLQMVTGLALCIVPALELSFVLLWLLLGMYVALFVLHAASLHAGDGLPTPLAHLILRNGLLIMAGLAIAAHTIRVSQPKTKPAK
jgi:hypothetical protein